MPDTVTLPQLQAHFLQTLSVERGASTYTIRNYTHTLVLFGRFLAHHLTEPPTPIHLCHLSQRDFRAFLSERTAQGVTHTTIRLDLSALKSFFRFLERRHGIENQAIATVRGPKRPKRLPRPIAESSAIALSQLNDAPHTKVTWQTCRDQALFSLLYGAGLRISEALALRWASPPTGMALHICGKGEKMRVIPLLPAITTAITRYQLAVTNDNKASLFLLNWPKENDDAIPLFFSARGKAFSPRMAQKRLENLRTELKLQDNATPHALRHAFATDLLTHSGDLRAIQELLGHSSLSTTQLYTDVSAQRILDIYEKARPKRRVS